MNANHSRVGEGRTLGITRTRGEYSINIAIQITLALLLPMNANDTRVGGGRGDAHGRSCRWRCQCQRYGKQTLGVTGGEYSINIAIQITLALLLPMNATTPV